ncbi:hypothetical protein QA802_00455 [Streptomyces sp. B21-105]
MDVAKVAEVTFTSPDRVRDVIHNFNADGFDSLYPKCKGGQPSTAALDRDLDGEGRRGDSRTASTIWPRPPTPSAPSPATRVHRDGGRPLSR